MTQLDWLAVVTIDGKTTTRYKHWSKSDKDLKFAKYLRTWGEAGTVKTRRVTTSKIEDRGTTCMLVGYALNHDSGVYRLWNEETDRVIVSRDVIWLKRMYYEKKADNPEMIVAPTFTNEVWEGEEDENEDILEPPIDESEEPEDESDTESQETDDNNEDSGEEIDNEDEESETAEETGPSTVTTRSGRTVRPPERLIEEIGLSSKQITNEISNLTHSERYYLTHLIMMQNDRNRNEHMCCFTMMKDEEDKVKEKQAKAKLMLMEVEKAN